MKTIHSKVLILLFAIIFSVFKTNAQSLTLQTAGADLLLGANDFTAVRSPSVDVHDNSGIRIYTWAQSQDPGGVQQDNKDIYCQIFDKDMNAMTIAFRVNKVNSADQLYPVVKINQNDETFVISWASNAGGDYDIYAKKLDIYSLNPTDVLNQNEILVNVNVVNTSLPTTAGRQITPFLAFDYLYNELIVVWRDQDGQDNPGNPSLGANGVFSRRINYSDFSLIKDQWLVNYTTVDQQILNSAEMNPVTGELYVCYQSFNGANNYDVTFRKFKRDSNYDFIGQTNPNETTINTHLSDYQQAGYIIVNKTTGDYVIGWTSNNQDGMYLGAYFRPFDKNNVQKTLPGSASEQRINIPITWNQHIPKIIWDEASGYLLCFYSYSDPAIANIKYQIFDNTFNYYGTEMAACSTATGEINVLYSFPNISVAYSQKKKQLSLAYQVYDQIFSFPVHSKLYVRSFLYSNALTDPPVCSNSNDNSINWVQETHFDEFGNIVSSSRSYSDNLGRPIQVQTKNTVENVVLASATLYDEQGRPTITTLPAPTTNSCFEYSSALMPYSSSDYDLPNNTGTFGEINNPKPVPTGLGSVGRYYSALNTLEPYVPASSYPYSRVDYNDQGLGVKRVSAPGEALRMGQGHEGSSVTLPITWELNHYLSLRKYYVTGNIVNQYTNRGTKSIVKDQNGVETVSFYDGEGKLLATCLSGSVGGVNENTITAPNYFSASLTYTIGNSFSITNSTSNVEIYISSSPNLYYVGPASSAPSGTNAFPNGVTVTITSLSTFQYSLAGTTYIASGHTSGLGFKDYQDIHVPAGEESTLSITAGSVTTYGPIGSPIPYGKYHTPITTYSTYEIIDMTTGIVVTASSIPAGYYRIKKTSGFAPIYVKNILNYYNFTYYYYDDAGRLVATISPNAVNLGKHTQPTMASTYEYNTLNWTLSKTTPDEGKTEYVYQKDGSIRFSQNALQKANNKFSYSNYNSIKQVIEAGEYTSDANVGSLYFQNMKGTVVISSTYVDVLTILESTDGVDDARCSEVTYSEYDSPDAGLSSFITGYTQRFLNNEISKTYKKATGTATTNISTTWYSYDESGNIEWTVKNIDGLGVKTANYMYDLSGNVLEVIYQKGTSERFEHFYEYDQMQRLLNVRTRRLTSDPYKQQAKYFYYLHGPLKRVELENRLQGIDYTYTINGWLKGINHPYLDNNDPGGDSYTGTNSVFSKDVFGMTLEYYTDDYVRDNKFKSSTGLSYDPLYNGTITSWMWNNTQSGSTMPSQYAYKYDKKYQLLQADYGTHNVSGNLFTISPTNAYQVSNLAYDNNGNILSMRRKDDAGATAFDSYYHIGANVNKLKTTSSDAAGIIINRSFTYDVIGRMTASNTAVAGETAKYVDYDVRGNVVAVYTNSAKTHPMVKYSYDEMGGRIEKTSYSTTSPYAAMTKTWYVRDAGGNVLSIHTTDINTSTTTQTELPIYGSIRIGTAFISAGPVEYDYELKDHLGNIRTVVRRNSVTKLLEVSSWTDYYPHGSIMPGRNYVGSPTYRNGYQGEYAEHSAETGWDEFDLRMYDSNLGRWFAPDPKHQYYSPYLGMGNNPVNLVDPDGGSVLDDIHLSSDGGYKVIKTNDSFDRFFFDGKYIGSIGKSSIGGVSLTHNEGYGGHYAGRYGYTIDGPVEYFGIDDPASGYYKPGRNGWASGAVHSNFDDLGAVLATELAVTSGVGILGYGVNAFRAAEGLKSLGLGTTGRITAENLTEQLAMKEAMSNPALGQVIERMKPLTDPRWFGWRKMQYEHIGLDGSKTIIHYNGQWSNGVLKAVDDFKFK
jgi:RHS repeat-associated protein